MFDEINKAIAEIQQPRSRFQLERFVLGAQSTPEMQYYQTLLELQDMIYKHKMAVINVKISEAKIKKLRQSGDEVDELKAQRIELGLEQTKLAMIGSEREISDLVEIFNQFKHKYTREEIEAAQPEYWKQRLTKTAQFMLMGGSGVAHAHIEAMEQANVLESFIEQVQESKKELSN